MFLLDTNVLSELERRLPDPSVVAWLRSTPQELLYVSVVSLSELIRGVKGHSDPERRQQLQHWLDVDIRTWIDQGLTPVTMDIAELAGSMAAIRKLAGRPLSFQDSLIAGTAAHHKFILVTRNERDFVDLNLRILNPWDAARP